MPLKLPNGENGDFHILKFVHSSNKKYYKTFFDIFRVPIFDILIKVKIWPVGGAVRPTNFFSDL